MHGWFDQRGEGGLRIGIRRFPDDKDDPSGRKPAWFVFQAFGTDREEEAFEFAKKIIGIDSWDQIIYKEPIAMPTPSKKIVIESSAGILAYFGRGFGG